MHLPEPRGPLSSWAISTLSGRPVREPDVRSIGVGLADDDAQLALWISYELHYQGFDEVDDRAEWDPTILAFRAELEAGFLAELRRQLPARDPAPGDIPAELATVTGDSSGPSLSAYLQRRADRAEFAEFVAHRSVYHLKEADPHTFAIPRLRGAAKAAMVEIQADEYGGGRVERMHSTLFADVMTHFGLDTTYGAYVEQAPGITLATSNVMSLFGLHRAWRGAAAGHLAALEMTSSLPNRRYGLGMRRLGAPERPCQFFDEHIEADAVHEQIAAHDLCGTLAEQEPLLAPDIVFGAASCMLLENLFARQLLGAWGNGGSSFVVAGGRAA